MKIKVKIPNCKCMEKNSDLLVSRTRLDTSINVWGMDYQCGARVNELEHNFCPQCGTKYNEDERYV